MKHLKLVLAISVISVIAVIAIVLGLLHYNPQALADLFSVFVRDALWTSVLVTVVLVAVNISYLLQNRQTINEMKKAREAEFMPHVRADLSFFGIVPVVKITNFGKGPAIDVRTKINFSAEEMKPWEQAVMSPNESIHLILPGSNMNEILKRAGYIRVNGEYEDIFGKTYPMHDEMNTKEFIEQTQKLPPILEESLSMLVKKIVKELEDIKREIRDIRQD